MFIYALALAVMAASCHGFAAFPHASVRQTNDVITTMRLQSAQLTEISLSSKSDEEMGCMKRMLCSIGVKRAQPETREFVFPKVSLGRGVEDFMAMLEVMTKEVMGSNLDSKNFSAINEMLNSFAIGKESGDQAKCDKEFVCPTSGEWLITEAMKPAGKQYGATEQRGRATCKAAGLLCPGISIGCALCSIFSLGNCGTQCLTFGFYCSASDFACKLEEA